MSYFERYGLPTREIALLQEIFPFGKSEFLGTGHGYPIATWIRLTLPSDRQEGISLNFLLSLQYSTSTNIEVVPLRPGKGYILDSEDLNLDSRRAKLLRMAMPCNEVRINPAFPLGLEAQIHIKDLLELGNLRLEQDGLRHLTFDRDVGTLLDSIRILVSANGLYETRLGNLWKNIYVKRESNFTIPIEGFYPTDTGPLPNEYQGFTFSVINSYGDRIVHVGHGHNLRFGDNETERSKIGIRFILDKRALAGKP